MKKVVGNRICEDCKTSMFRRGIDTDMNKTMIGWSCPKCHTTKWDEIK
jgi:ribosomal protein S27AE